MEDFVQLNFPNRRRIERIQRAARCFLGIHELKEQVSRDYVELQAYQHRTHNGTEAIAISVFLFLSLQEKISHVQEYTW